MYKIGKPQVLWNTPDAPASGGATSAGPAASTSGAPAGGTPASAPSTSPSSGAPGVATITTPGSSTPSSEAPPEIDYEALMFLGGGDPDAAPVVPPPAPVPAPAPAAAVAPPVPPTVDPSKPVPAAPAATPPAPAAATSGPQDSSSPPPNPAEPTTIANYLAQNEPSVIDHLSKTVFALSPQELEALENDAVGSIPRLMARSFVKAQQTMLHQMARSVPLMVGKHIQTMITTTKNEGAFYARWPDLKPDVHGQLLGRLAAQYRQANPTVPTDQMIEEVGALAMQLGKVVPSAPSGAPAPIAPHGQPRPPQPTPFAPAGGGGGGQAQQVAADDFSFMVGGQDEG